MTPGDALSRVGLDGTASETLDVINNWRSCHGFQLQVIKMTLLNRAGGARMKKYWAGRRKGKAGKR